MCTSFIWDSCRNIQRVWVQKSNPDTPQVDASEAKDDDDDLLPPLPQQVKIHHTIAKSHPVDQILGDVSKGVQTRSCYALFCEHYLFVSCLEPSNVDQAQDDPN